MGPGELRIEVVYAAAPHQIEQRQLTVPPGATAADALRASGLAVLRDADTLDTLQLGIWGHKCTPDTVLRDRDRVELCRALVVDPKEARRQRYRKDGVKKRHVPARRRA
jgi:uncharacterized protein